MCGFNLLSGALAAASIAQSPLEDDGGGEGSKVDKGKGRAVEEFWDEDDGADDDFSEEERRVKKAKKPKLKKKVRCLSSLRLLGSSPDPTFLPYLDRHLERVALAFHRQSGQLSE